MRFIFISAGILLVWFNVQAQISKKQNLLDSIPSFTLTFTQYNHAERLHKGTLKYVVTDTSLNVIRIPFFEGEEETIFLKPLSKLTKSIALLSATNLDTLKSYYDNKCVMITSGDEYTLTFETKRSSKSIRLHHYYLKRIEDIIALINKSLPKKFKIYYVSREAEQDCDI
ncbi:MAG: hypothetical protein V4539_24790 [Bacteroidota bacterium]